MYRDELLDEARRMMKSAGIDQELEDDRIAMVEDIIYDQPVYAREPNSSQMRNYQNSKIS
jgi:hypothetical protein